MESYARNRQSRDPSFLFLHGFGGCAGHFLGRTRAFLRIAKKQWPSLSAEFVDGSITLPTQESSIEEEESQNERSAPSKREGRYRCWWYYDEDDPWNTEVC